MNTLFVDKTVQIKAPVLRVWDVITNCEFSNQWSKEFSSGGPQLHIESDWLMGSAVNWKGEDGATIVEGKITRLDPLKLICFTVHDPRRTENLPQNDKDGITFELSEEGAVTTLHVLQGDFSVISNGEELCRLSREIWDRVLVKMKELGEKEVSLR